MKKTSFIVASLIWAFLGASEDIPLLTLSETARKLAQIEVSPVEKKGVTIATPLYGILDYDETRLAKIAAWMSGRIDALYVDYLGIEVEQGEPMALIYSPELVTAQAELIESKKVLQGLSESMLSFLKRSSRRSELAAYEKLRLLGITDAQMMEIINSGIPSDHLNLYAPLGGTVINLAIREGMYVQTGDPLYVIADLSHLWVICDAYESDLIWIKEGKEVAFEVEAYPGNVFTGTVAYIDPMVNTKTRTIRVRLDVPNPNRLLKPGMFIQAFLKSLVTDVVIPASAPLITGKRAVVYVEVPDEKWKYEGRVITLGPKAGDYYIVKEGVTVGERVVTHGNFKIDSAMQIMAKPSMMSPKEKENVIEESMPIVKRGV